MVKNLHDLYKNNVVIHEEIEALFNKKEIFLKTPLNKQALKKLSMRVKAQAKTSEDY